ncbi:MAG TPA: Hsp20/alpha crystallin family protein [Candidatus Brocadiia bacterium]|nr:Hsp20/alpha crystallin family protein [Candidatus Brocadiia bacterium]
MPRKLRAVSFQIGPGSGDLHDLARKYCLVRDVLQQQQPSPAWEPPTDVYETDSEVVIQMELAGVKPEQMELETNGDVLTIRGTRELASDTTPQRCHRREIRRGCFQKRVLAGKGLDASRVEASSADGILTIRIPKAVSADSQKIIIYRV